MTSAEAILQKLQIINKYPIRINILRTIQLAVTPCIYEQGMDAIRSSLILHLQTKDGQVALKETLDEGSIDFGKAVAVVLTGVSLGKDRESFIEAVFRRFVTYFDKLKRAEENYIDEFAIGVQDKVFQETWKMINQSYVEKNGLFQENMLLMADTQRQKEEIDSLKKLLNEREKAFSELQTQNQELSNLLQAREAASKLLTENIQSIQQSCAVFCQEFASKTQQIEETLGEKPEFSSQKISLEDEPVLQERSNNTEDIKTNQLRHHSEDLTREEVANVRPTLTPKRQFSSPEVVGPNAKTEGARQGNTEAEHSKKKSYNYIWRQHIQLQKLISEKLEPLAKVVSCQIADKN